MDGASKYTKLRPLGKGNMGVVNLVKRNSDGKIFVMKLIDLSKMNRKERNASLNEAKVLSSLTHPNVVLYVESFLARKTDHLCIVMEFAEGGDLSSKVKNRRGQHFTEDQILDWFIQICFAIDYCHRKRVLHRDIKTQNIFLTNSGICKVGDFGISRILQNTFDVAHTFVGTPYYLSPELVQEKPYNHMSDVWAMGVVLYELMALRHPFNAMDMKGLMYKIMKVQYDPPPQIYSAELRAIIPKLLVKEPSKRLRVSQILELPIIRNRILKWNSGLVELPPPYISELRKYGILHTEREDGDVSHPPHEEEEGYFEDDFDEEDGPSAQDILRKAEREAADRQAHDRNREAEKLKLLEQERERQLRERLILAQQQKPVPHVDRMKPKPLHHLTPMLPQGGFAVPNAPPGPSGNRDMANPRPAMLLQHNNQFLGQPPPQPLDAPLGPKLLPLGPTSRSPSEAPSNGPQSNYRPTPALKERDLWQPGAMLQVPKPQQPQQPLSVPVKSKEIEALQAYIENKRLAELNRIRNVSVAPSSSRSSALQHARQWR